MAVKKKGGGENQVKERGALGREDLRERRVVFFSLLQGGERFQGVRKETLVIKKAALVVGRREGGLKRGGKDSGPAKGKTERAIRPVPRKR